MTAPSRLKTLLRRWRRARIARRQAATLRVNPYLARDVGIDVPIATTDPFLPHVLPIAGAAPPHRREVTADACSIRYGTGAPSPDPRPARRSFP